jgi:hypothetical protein
MAEMPALAEAQALAAWLAPAALVGSAVMLVPAGLAAWPVQLDLRALVVRRVLEALAVA